MSVPVSGFTFVRNAVRLDFPLAASLRSILPICDEVVVNVGRSDDGTLELVRSLDDPRIRIIESEWDLSRGRAVLADQTAIAQRACRHPWGLYIQADEVLHEGGIPALREAIDAADGDRRVDALVVRYHHLYGGLDTELTGRRAYRREIRAIRLDPTRAIHSYRDAQGFRVGPADRHVPARLVDAEIFHYGWARPAAAIQQKHREMDRFWWSPAERAARAARAAGGAAVPLVEWVPGLKPLGRAHPAAVAEWVAARRESAAGLIGPRHWKWKMLRYVLLDGFERVTGIRPFEFRNYTLV